MTKKIDNNILIKFAAKFAESIEQGEFSQEAMPRIAKQINDPTLTEAVAQVVAAMRMNGAFFHQALHGQNGAFSEEFIEAARASDNDGGRVRPYHIFLKYRKLNETLNREFSLEIE